MWFAVFYIMVFFFFILRMLGLMSARLYKYMLMQDISNSLRQVGPPTLSPLVALSRLRPIGSRLVRHIQGC